MNRAEGLTWLTLVSCVGQQRWTEIFRGEAWLMCWVLSGPLGEDRFPATAPVEVSGLGSEVQPLVSLVNKGAKTQIKASQC